MPMENALIARAGFPLTFDGQSETAAFTKARCGSTASCAQKPTFRRFAR